jgi:hypothetical protein
MMQFVGVSKKFWAKVIATTNYVQNHLPTKVVHQMILEEKWNECKPTLTFEFLVVKPICTYWMKLDEKSLKCILLGYDEHLKANRLYHMPFKIAKINRDVMINE